MLILTQSELVICLMLRIDSFNKRSSTVVNKDVDPTVMDSSKTTWWDDNRESHVEASYTSVYGIVTFKIVDGMNKGRELTNTYEARFDLEAGTWYKDSNQEIFGYLKEVLQ